MALPVLALAQTRVKFIVLGSTTILKDAMVDAVICMHAMFVSLRTMGNGIALKRLINRIVFLNQSRPSPLHSQNTYLITVTSSVCAGRLRRTAPFTSVRLT